MPECSVLRPAHQRAPLTTTSVMVIGVLVVASGCFTYRPARGPVRERTMVRLRFDPPRPIDVVLSGRDTSRVPDVTQVEGRVLGARGDTLEVTVRRIWGVGGLVPSLSESGATARVAPAAGQLTETRRLSKWRTALAAYLGTSLAVASLLAVLTATNHY